MSETTPERPFLPRDMSADTVPITAYAAYRGFTDWQEAVAAWRNLTEAKRENWRAATHGAVLASDLERGAHDGDAGSVRQLADARGEVITEMLETFADCIERPDPEFIADWRKRARIEAP
jgi:alpha-ketoglutarate-dependent taurine dioxygenase